jgi:hypothetical protein
VTTPVIPPIANYCDNPDLAEDASGWGVITGGTAQRVAEWNGATDPGDVYVYRLASSNAGPGVYLPSKEVNPGEKWGFGVVCRVAALAAGGSCRARMNVDWYDDDDFLGHTDGDWYRLNYEGNRPRFVGHLFTVPANASRANVTIELNGAVTPNSWAMTEAFYARGEVHDPTQLPSSENICSNPVLELNTAGWGVVSNAVNPQRVEVDDTVTPYGFQVEATNPDPSTGVVEPAVHAPALAVFEGNYYDFSVNAHMTGVEDGSAGVRLRIDYYAGTAPQGSAYGSSAGIDDNNSWPEVFATGLIPAGVDNVKVVAEGSAVASDGSALLQVTDARYVRNFALSRAPRSRPVRPPTPVGQRCPNPRLATDLEGWSSPDGVARVLMEPDGSDYACESQAHQSGGEYANQINMPSLTDLTTEPRFKFQVNTWTEQPGRAYLRIVFRDAGGVALATIDSDNFWVDDTWRTLAVVVDMPAGSSTVDVGLNTYGMDTGNSVDAPRVRATFAYYTSTSGSGGIGS